MHSTLFTIFGLPIRSYGLMMVVGFALGIWRAVRVSKKRYGIEPERVYDLALVLLVGGILGARVVYILLNPATESWGSFFAVWQGGLSFHGGLACAMLFGLVYTRIAKLPYWTCGDLVAPSLAIGYAFTRIGCFLNGCCYGRPTDLPWGVRFPYRSYAYNSQINADPARGRTEPHLPLPAAEYAAFVDDEGRWYAMSLAELTPPQRYEVTKGEYRCRPVHPTQLYASVNALLLCAILYMFWRRSLGWPRVREQRGWSRRPGFTTAAFLMLYGVTRFLLEFVRDDNPFEIAWLTISQILGLLLLAAGMILLAALMLTKPSPIGQLRVVKQPEKPRRAGRASGKRLK